MKSKFKALNYLKPLVLFVLIAAMTLGMVACTDKGGAPDNGSTDTNSPNNNNDVTPPTDGDNGEQTTPPNDENKTPAEPTVLKFDELVTNLSSSPFRDFITTKTNYGISDVGAVGVDKDRFENEILYAFPADSEFKKAINIADHGFGSNKSATDNSAAVAAALNELRSVDGKKKLVFPEGEFKLSEAITIDGFKDLYVTGNNTKLVYANWTQAYVVNNSEDVYTANLSYTFETPSMITGKVVEYDSKTKTVTLKIDEKQDISAYNNKKTVWGYYDLEWNESENRYYINTKGNTRYAAKDDFIVDQNSLTKKTVQVKFSSDPEVTPVKDTLVSVTLEQYSGGKSSVSTYDSKNVYFENISINSTPAMAFVATSSENIYVNRLSIYPDIEKHLYTSTSADGIHTTDIRGDFVLTNSIVDGTQDDCLNVCATYDKVTGAGGKTIKLQKNGSRILEGDTIEVYDPNTMKLHGSYKVVSIQGTSLTVDSTINPEIVSGFIVGNVSGATHLTIDNCIFANTYSRGGLIQCRDSKIINSTYYNMTLSPLVIHSTNDNYKEAIMPRNITVENCKFYNCNTKQLYYASVQVITHNGNGGTTPGTLTDVNIKNCFFGETGGSAVLFYGAGNSSFTNNLMYNLNRIKKLSWAEGMCDCAVGIVSSNDITAKDNYAYVEGITPTFEMFGISGSSNFTEENNKKIFKK